MSGNSEQISFAFDYPYAHGGPVGSARFRVQPEDFFVDEVLGFEPVGDGEHIFLRVEKRQQNTDWLAKQIARFVGVRPFDVGYSGLKDRHAVTRQWFSVYFPKSAEPNWRDFTVPGVTILTVQRHCRKLRRGTHRSNLFNIRLRELSAARADLEARLVQLEELGVPNYFGEQRFGKNANNLVQAQRSFASGRKTKQRSQYGMMLSAARAYLFNAVLAVRVADNNWCEAMPGDVFMLARNGAPFYFPDGCDEAEWSDVIRRIANGTVNVSGPLWGAGDSLCSAQAAILESNALTGMQTLQEGLVAAGLKHERRSLRLIVNNLKWVFDELGHLILQFALPVSGYATAVLRELVQADDAALSKAAVHRSAVD